MIGNLQNPDLIPTNFSFDTTISSVSGEDDQLVDLAEDRLGRRVRWVALRKAFGFSFLLILESPLAAPLLDAPAECFVDVALGK